MRPSALPGLGLLIVQGITGLGSSLWPLWSGGPLPQAPPDRSALSLQPICHEQAERDCVSGPQPGRRISGEMNRGLPAVLLETFPGALLHPRTEQGSPTV